MTIRLNPFRGFKGTAKLQEDGVCYGKITGINDLVTFHAYTRDLLQQSFEDAVDDYCLTCEELGKPW